MAEQEKKRLFLGKVISTKMDKTIVVATRSTFKDPRFGKVLHRNKKYKVHDVQGEAREGDVVEFYETAPISKTKYMQLARVVTRSAV